MLRFDKNTLIYKQLEYRDGYTFMRMKKRKL